MIFKLITIIFIVFYIIDFILYILYFDKIEEKKWWRYLLDSGFILYIKWKFKTQQKSGTSSPK